MRDGFAPLIIALAMLVLSATFLYIDTTQRVETALLASEIEAFLEDHRIESADHFEAQQKARQLENLIQRPNRTPLTLLSLIMAVQFSLAFFRNPKGRVILQKATDVWTWRP